MGERTAPGLLPVSAKLAHPCPLCSSVEWAVWGSGAFTESSSLDSRGWRAGTPSASRGRGGRPTPCTRAATAALLGAYSRQYGGLLPRRGRHVPHVPRAHGRSIFPPPPHRLSPVQPAYPARLCRPLLHPGGAQRRALVSRLPPFYRLRAPGGAVGGVPDPGPPLGFPRPRGGEPVRGPEGLGGVRAGVAVD